jgi:hypothetical protein
MHAANREMDSEFIDDCFMGFSRRRGDRTLNIVRAPPPVKFPRAAKSLLEFASQKS